ncbi:MAG TPA: SDR family NAD(P)-dependent oxidoreductase [Gaiellaceae bacterium]
MSGRAVAVITGASSGIGESIARALAARDFHCVLLARREDRLRDLAAAVGGEFEVCDVGEREQVEAVAARVLERHPEVKLLVNCAGIAARTSFFGEEWERIDAVTRVNYLGTVWSTRAFLPGLERAAPSDVVTIVSVAGLVAVGGGGPYAAAKHAQLAFSRGTQPELARRGIHVHTVLPGFVETEGFPQDRFTRHRPLRRFVPGPDYVAMHVLRAIDRNLREIVIPWWYRPLAFLPTVAPGLVARVMSRVGPTGVHS